MKLDREGLWAELHDRIGARRAECKRWCPSSAQAKAEEARLRKFLTDHNHQETP